MFFCHIILLVRSMVNVCAKFKRNQAINLGVIGKKYRERESLPKKLAVFAP